MIRCPVCGTEGRIVLVNENAPAGATADYICTNRRCTQYMLTIGTEVLRSREEQTDAAEMGTN